ncbi:MAG: 4-hydroxy-tetrahydrodipicolinate synthase [Clostridia bacterium]|nr:4-hydroxy-tetrahydrodipicolinate synthase [Clostridia bacterium]
MKKILFTGAATALVTPFNNDGEIDFDTFGKIVEMQIQGGIDALVVCGTTGEGSTLSDAEHKSLIRYCVEKVNGRVPVIAGTGSNDTNYGIQLSKFAQSEGVDGLLVITPYYNKTTQKGLVRHFNTIADSVDIPCILYNVPSRTGVNIQPNTYLELSKHENIIAFKEANGNIADITKTMSLVGDNLTLYSGDDDQIVPLMSVGGKGVISVLSNIFPSEVHRLCTSFLEGNLEESRQLQFKYLDLINALFCEVNPIPVKTALGYLGVCSDRMRLPLVEMEDNNKARLIKALEAVR